jgi:hypothetical protein
MVGYGWLLCFVIVCYFDLAQFLLGSWLLYPLNRAIDNLFEEIIKDSPIMGPLWGPAGPNV